MQLNLKPPSAESILNPIVFGFLLSFGLALGNWVIGLVPWPM